MAIQTTGSGSGGGVVAKVAAGVAISAIAGIVVWVFTHPGGVINPVQPTPPAQLGGNISSATISNGNPCCTFAVRVSIQGFNGQPCQLEWVLVDASTGAATTPQPAVTLTPQADTDTADPNVMVPISIRGSYYVQFILVDPNGVELARQNSPTFTVS
jgi:hypothetical protein